MNTLKIMLALGLLCLSSASVQAVEIRDHHKEVIGKDCKACHDQGIKQFLQIKLVSSVMMLMS